MDKSRIVSNKINKLLEMFPAVAVLGPRQCGKSTLVKNLGSKWRYYDLENPSDHQLITSDPSTFFKLNSQHVIIDEAQQYPQLFQVLRGVIDADRKNKGRFILTGSSSPEIVSGLNESLAGRIATVQMAPFKFCEVYEEQPSAFYEVIINGPKDLKHFFSLKSACSIRQALEIWYSGGFPEPVLERESNNTFYKLWMENYIGNYVNRDVRALFPRLNIHNFKRFLTLLAQFSGRQLNMSEMARSLEVSVSTIKDYLDIIHQTFIWRNLEPFEKNALKKVQKSVKGFFRDQGMLHYYLKINSLDDLMIHPVAGFSFECFVIEEIIRAFESKLIGQVDYSYYRTIDKSEIDLIVDGPFGIVPIEIKLGSVTKVKSLQSLTNFIEDMKLDFGIVVNTGDKVELLTDKIIQIPVNYL